MRSAVTTGAALALALGCAGCDSEDLGGGGAPMGLPPPVVHAAVPPPAIALTAPAPAEPTTAELHVGVEGALVAQSFAGAAGADVAASARRAECAGWIASAPALLLMLDAPIETVRFRVESSADTTLLIERADGHFLCNDDSDGLSPVIGGALPAGVHRVWVGVWDREEAGATYTLSIDRELPDETPRGEPTVDRLNAVCAENWCASGTAYRFEQVECDGASCRVGYAVDGVASELVLPDVPTSWGEEGLEERFVEALGEALGSR